MSARGVIIRPARPEDATAMGRVFQESWLATYPHEGMEITREDILSLDLAGEENTQRRFESLTRQDPASRRGVAELNGEIIGLFGVELCEGYGYLRALYVLPEYFSCGIGAALIVQALKEVEDYETVYLNVASYNERAIRFYERFGFCDSVEGPEFTGGHFQSGAYLPQKHMVRRREK
ncbi:MAG: GNAT family N-acetyltransferase [bacterium]